MLLISRPELVIDEETGRPVLKKDKERAEWNAELTCGEATNGCGSVLLVKFPDVFKHVARNPLGMSIGYRCKCPHCHEDIPIPHEGVPWNVDDVPERTAWLRKAMEHLTRALFTEAEDWTRLRADLLQDGMSERVLVAVESMTK